MPKITGSTIVKLLVACFLVGAALAYFNVDPRDLLTHSVDLAKDLANWSVSVFGSALSYVLLGAVVVLPIWLIVYLLRAARGKK